MRVALMVVRVRYVPLCLTAVALGREFAGSSVGLLAAPGAGESPNSKLSYSNETDLSNKSTKTCSTSFEDSPRKPLRRRPPVFLFHPLIFRPLAV